MSDDGEVAEREGAASWLGHLTIAHEGVIGLSTSASHRFRVVNISQRRAP